jgi:hypothetical protein
MKTEEFPNYPYLVQRIDRVKDPTKYPDAKGVDRYFSFDYMGAAEFEWGALPQAMKKMLAAVDDSWEVTKVTVDTHTCWYVGPASALKLATALFADQLNDYDQQKHRLKESTYIRYVYIEKNEHFKAIGWWSLGHDPFVLFVSKANAKQWLKCIREANK